MTNVKQVKRATYVQQIAEDQYEEGHQQHEDGESASDQSQR